MSTAEKRRYTVEEYLTMERASETKHEYYQGEIFAMSGASRKHNLISGNLITALNIQLRGQPCEVYGGDQRVKVSPTGLYTYPDLSIACSEPKFEDTGLETLLNPKLIVEVLSESTEGYDRGEKFAQYRTLESFEEYVLVSQQRHRVEVFTRQDADHWLFSVAQGLESNVELESLGCSLSLEDVYFKVEINEPTLDEPNDQPTTNRNS